MKIFIKVLLLLLVLLNFLVLAQSPTEDQVEVPVPNYNHKFYSGYLDIDPIAGKSIHYLFFQSQNDISQDPLIIWLSGGPGCSSLLGAFHQNGPFVFRPGNSSWQLNKHAWNTNANLLYLELPAGVGFSTRAADDDQVNDKTTLQQAVVAIRLFLSRFNKFKKNSILLTGHAYASVFVTMLAKEMIIQNKDPFSIFNDKWLLKGIMVGNPCTKPDECFAPGTDKSSPYHYEFLYKRAFLTKKAYEKFQGLCSFNYNGFECYQQRELLDKMFASANTSQYNIYDKCYKGKNDTISYINTGCQDQAGLINYLNDKIYQQNWNIRPKVWKPCDTQIFNDYLTGNGSFHIYPYLIENSLKIWVYSGDLDSKIPVLSTKKWVAQLREHLQIPIRKNWREWWVEGQHPGQDQVGGFIWELEGLTLVTVKGAGLRTGYDQPFALSKVLDGFINGKTLPYKH